MNRILLIGNGFDLAHNLYTGYDHFVNDFWEQKVKKIYDEYKEQSKPSKNNTYNIYFSFNNDNDIEIEPVYYQNKYNEVFSSEKKGYAKFKDLLLLINQELVPENTIKNNFLKQITLNLDIHNWVDIECEYFSALKECFENEKKDEIKKLNKEFDSIKEALTFYLNNLIKQGIEPIQSINNLIDNIIFENTSTKIMYPSNNFQTIFLCFNYTNTIEYYINNLKEANQYVKSIYIHGELNKASNPIIFGYDDNSDEEFNRIRKNPNKEYSENVKTINYLKTGLYNELMKFIENNEYHVYILGHSLGVSDSTIISNIFKSNNCESIKIYYYIDKNNISDHKEKRINVLRVLNNDIQKINKIVPEDKCEQLSEIKYLLPNPNNG